MRSKFFAGTCILLIVLASAFALAQNVVHGAVSIVQLSEKDAERLADIFGNTGVDITKVQKVEVGGTVLGYVYEASYGFDDVFISADGNTRTEGTLNAAKTGIDTTKSYHETTYTAGRIVSVRTSEGAVYNFGVVPPDGHFAVGTELLTVQKKGETQVISLGSGSFVKQEVVTAEGRTVLRDVYAVDAGIGEGIQVIGGQYYYVQKVTEKVDGKDVGVDRVIQPASSSDVSAAIRAQAEKTAGVQTGATPTPDQLTTINAEVKRLQENAELARTATEEQRKAAAQQVKKIDSFGEFVTTLLQVQYEWRGLGQLGALFIGKDEVAERRTEIREKFCTSVLGVAGGPECAANAVCESYSDKRTGSNVVLQVVPGRSVRAAAYIQAEKTGPIDFSDELGQGQQWLYKVTYYASSPDDANTYQLRFFRDDGPSVDAFAEPKGISQGGAISAQGSAAQIRYSKKNFGRVCIIFGKSIKSSSGSTNRVCTPIANTDFAPQYELPGVPSLSSNSQSTTSAQGSTPTVRDWEVFESR